MDKHLKQELLRAADKYNNISKKINYVVGQQSELVLESIKILLDYPHFGTPKCINEVTRSVLAVQNFVSNVKPKYGPYDQHLSAVSSGILIVSCVSMSLTNIEIAAVNETVRHYTDRILKTGEFDDDDEHRQDQEAWVCAWLDLLDELQTYSLARKKNNSPNDMNDIGDATSIAIYKDQSEASTFREDVPVNSTTDSESASSLSSISSLSPTIPLIHLNGKKWFVRNQNDEQNLFITHTELDNTVNVSNCTNVCLTIAGKITAITVERCCKTHIILDSLIANFQFIKCEDVKMEAKFKVPLIDIYKTNKCSLRLTKESKDVEIITSICTGVNLSMEGENSQKKNYTFPERFSSVLIPGEGLHMRPYEQLNYSFTN